MVSELRVGKGIGEVAVDFSQLVLGFSSAALHYLGETHPFEKVDLPVKNLILARQNIDILELLSSKTRGNLLADEEKILAEVLTDLRLKYVHASK